MYNELKDASESLHTALERYLNICSSIQSRSSEENASRRIPRDVARLIKQEFPTVQGYESRLRDAKTAITVVHNSAFHISPINALPPEVLMHIFHIIFQGEPCNIDHLAQVCSHWRSVAISSHYLWSHIDYHPDKSELFHPELLDHAKLHVARSGRVPLEIHISASIGCDGVDIDLHDEAELFFQSIAPRMWALDLDLENFDMFDNATDTYHAVIDSLILYSTPGMLTKLITLDPGFDGFITPGHDNIAIGGDCGLALLNSSYELDQVFASIAVLHLQGLYPRWQSLAYHGLVDLRITPAYNGSKPLSEWELMGILRASPELRILHFGYPITGRFEGDISQLRVNLGKLEVLQIASFPASTSSDSKLVVHDILRLISPGPEPLHVGISCRFYDVHETPGDLSIVDIEAFFARAKVAKLYASECSLPDKFFRMSSHLKILILDKFNHSLSPLLPIDRHNDGPPTSPPTIEYCYLMECSLESDRLYSMVQQCSVRTLILFKCKFYSNGEEVAREGVLEELSRICPVVEFSREKPRLIAHQELFD